MDMVGLSKIAFCFMIYSSIENEDLWVDFFSKADQTKFNIYVHAKDPDAYTGVFSKYIIDEHIETKYGSWSLVKCSNALFRKAFHSDSDNIKFVLLSGHCIPVKTFAHVYNTIAHNDHAYICLSPAHQIFPRYLPLLNFFSNCEIAKHHQWVILTRADVAFIKEDPYLECFENIDIPDESYYITVLRKNGTASHVQTNLLTTFTQWEEDLDIQTYTSISKEELHNLTSKVPFPLFARKFAKGSVPRGYLDACI
jgi:hypothetical protein